MTRAGDTITVHVAHHTPTGERVVLLGVTKHDGYSFAAALTPDEARTLAGNLTSQAEKAETAAMGANHA